MRRLLLLTFIVVGILSCGSQSNEFTIEGKVSNSDNEKIYLAEMKMNRLKKIDSVQVKDDGTFSFTGYTNIPKFFTVYTTPRNSLTLVVGPDEDIKLTGNIKSLKKTYEVKGSEGSEKIHELRNNLIETVSKLDSLGQIFKNNPDKEPGDQLRMRLNKESNEIVKKHKEYTKQFIDDNLGSLATIMALYQQLGPQSYVLNPRDDLKYYEKVDSSLMELYPNSEPVKSLHSQIKMYKSRMKENSVNIPNLEIGNVPPEIALPNPQGDTIALSSLRGEYVLLDFWASWCKPCRIENPNLVRAYKRFKDKGFEIYQVSLDKKRSVWVNAIEKDNLDWIHVSDLNFWNSSVVRSYNLSSIPANFLLNKKGEIVAKNLRGDALHAKLNEVLKEN
jgi:peroxiredoxin